MLFRNALAQQPVSLNQREIDCTISNLACSFDDVAGVRQQVITARIGNALNERVFYRTCFICHNFAYIKQMIAEHVRRHNNSK
jgi:hypothetical protein